MENTADRQYNISALTYNSGKFITVMENCNGWTVINTGDTIAFINDIILYPGLIGTRVGDSISIGGNEGEIYKGNLKLAFQFPTGATPSVMIIQKFFIHNKKC